MLEGGFWRPRPKFAGLRIPDGKHAGRSVRLRFWQRKEIFRIYGSATGTRRAILTFGRKNGKSALAAMLLLVHICGPEAVMNTELYSSALSRDQAGILFRLAAKMVRMCELESFVVIRETIKQIYCPGLGTVYESLSADASTAMGKSPVFLIHDELGQVRGPRHRLYDALETATSAHDNPLSIIISTQAATDNDLLSILIDDALTGADPRTKVRMYTAPEDMDPFSEEAIRCANPAFGDFQNAKEVLDMAAAARRMPAREAEYRNLVLNQRVERNSPFVSKDVWKENGTPPEPLRAVYGGLDLSETNDLTALVLVSPGSEGCLDVGSTFWLPGEGLAERSRQDRVPYDLWHEQGHLQTTPGRAVDYDFVARHIVKLQSEVEFRKIAFDRWNIKHLRSALVRAGMSEPRIDSIFVEFGQGYASMSPALRTLETMLLERRLRHGMHPVLTMCAANAVIKMDDAGGRKFTKALSRGRIDGMVALAMACAVAEEHLHETHVYADVPLEAIIEAD